MAELPDLGSHCSLEGCHQLDFLPFTCATCQAVFCKEHFPVDGHQCKAFTQPPEPRPLLPSTPEFTPEKCHFGKCGAVSSLLKPMVACKQCLAKFCMQHRNELDHACPSQNGRDEDAKMSKTRALVDKIVSSQSRPTVKPTKDTLKHVRLQAKVQLLKLKQGSEGQKCIAPADRAYFKVHYLSPGGGASTQTKDIFVCKEHSLGKVVDTMADLCGVHNPNNVSTSAKRLHLFRMSDGHLLTTDYSCSLASCLANDSIVNGESVILDLAE